MRKKLVSKTSIILSFAIMGTSIVFADENPKEISLNESGKVSIYELAENLNYDIKKTDDFKYTTITYGNNDSILLSDNYYTIHLNGVAKFINYTDMNGFLVPQCEKISLDENSDIFLSKEFIEANKDELKLYIKDGKVYSLLNEEPVQSDNKDENQVTTSTEENDKEESTNNNSNSTTTPENNNSSSENNSNNGNSGSNNTPSISTPPSVEEEAPTPPAIEEPVEPDVSGNGIYINTPSNSYLTSLGLRYEGYQYVLDNPEYTPDNQLGILPYILEVEISSGNINIKFSGSLPSEGYSILNYAIADSTAANQAISENNSMTTINYGNYSVFYRPGQSITISY